MSSSNTSLLRNFPSLKALLFFNTVGKHLNLVRAGEELHLTQGALSRQLKSLEEHLGVELFRRGPRGLAFTQEGELLYDYSKRAFETLGVGLRHLSVVTERQTLMVSVARSFAVRILGSRIASFLALNPWIDLHIDVHRYFVDLESSGADISIRLGRGDWEADRMQCLTGDAIWAVCNADVKAQFSGRVSEETNSFMLRNVERDYWEAWLESGRPSLTADNALVLHFNDSATMLEAAQAGAGLCLTRASLAVDAVNRGTLVRLTDDELHDGLNYYAICTARAAKKRAVDLFMSWLHEAFASQDAPILP
ncbi:Transcriptional regulator, LysR family (plasmid) [Cupriavidus sp. U2]|uniref:LysR substrate-binding domain-containing protein n=1 Tax=Cupriavidus sp. U2 TaxID=2920269 RepID=UPI00129E7E9D|nr:LysR family transcriptional regulator [Cupriavidus sp. U2]KAI3590370.1 Transcriptional regulator, LysR family [Cupriavidus sp. U2]